MTKVVVGVSASSGSPGALRMAAREAELRNAQLVAVQAWTPPRAPGTSGTRPPAVAADTKTLFAQAEKALRDQVIHTLGVEVECKLVRGTPSKVLLGESMGAELLVVDAPRGAISSVSPRLAHRLVYKTSCPVLIMPPSQSNAQ
ncbi:MAG: universal stress protein [Acidobacteria bacterium]|nr:universal stress protein [Acidobacteriota bacterium]